VHGILSRGAWFAKVERILHGNFDCKPLPYWQFRLPWVLSLFLYPIAILAMIAAGLLTAVTALLGAVTTSRYLVLATLLAAGIIALFHLLRRGAERRIRSLLGGLCGDARRPHLIAHSMGSWLGVHALLKSATLSVDRMILVGCVLPPRLDWQRLSGRVREVRNEVGRQDVVSMLAPFIPDMGQAGASGFRGEPHEVHDIDAALSACPHCSAPGLDVGPLVHNITLECYGHSDVFMEALHIRDLWLPALWGFPPEPYKRFSDTCTELVELAVDKKSALEAELKCHELRDQFWPWTTNHAPGRTLGQFIEATIRAQYARSGQTLPTGAALSDLVDWVIVLASGHLVAAFAQLETPIEGRDVALARRLFPPTAIGAAVEDTTA